MSMDYLVKPRRFMMDIPPLKPYPIWLRQEESETASGESWDQERVELMSDEHDSREDDEKRGAREQKFRGGKAGGNDESMSFKF